MFKPLFNSQTNKMFFASLALAILFATANLALADWESVPPGLQGSFGSIDQRYDRDLVPDLNNTLTWSDTAWRGERLGAQIVLWTASEVDQVSFSASQLSDGDGNTISASSVQPYFVKYVLSDDGSQGCGFTDFNIPPLVIPDVLDTVQQVDIPAENVRPIWLLVDVPADAAPAQYQGQVTVSATGQDPINFQINVKVLDLLQPDPNQWSYHYDLWQNPWSVARYHSVTPWSQAHIDLLNPLLTMLAKSGQKCITTTVVDRPWDGQTYDAFSSMVEWTKNIDQTWSYDYTVFDQYVQLCDSVGITKQINCYSMAPWSNEYKYFDVNTNDYVIVEAYPGTSEYNDLWEPFLADFVTHLNTKGWLTRTAIAMDENTNEEMLAVIDLIKTASPDLKIAMAGHYNPIIDPNIHDLCIWVGHLPPNVTEVAETRRQRGQVTTYYVCCSYGTIPPNNFTYSPPAESAWLGWYAGELLLDGNLRWAYNSWVEDPLVDTRHTKYQAGDCFMVYPGPRSSIRFERLREGIQAYEKIRILRQTLPEGPLARLEQTLDIFVWPVPGTVDCADQVNDAKAMATLLSNNIFDPPNDVTPPSPNPMTWKTEPYAVSHKTISMTATTASDESGVQYYFACIEDSNHDSGWYNSPTYAPANLQPETQYTFKVRARDLSINLNTTGWSSALSATTMADLGDMYINDVDIWFKFRGGWADPKVTVWIKEYPSGDNCEGATVYGTWSGAASEYDSGITEADGKVTMAAHSTKVGGTYTFTVTSVEKACYDYRPDLNVKTSDTEELVMP